MKNGQQMGKLYFISPISHRQVVTLELQYIFVNRPLKMQSHSGIRVTGHRSFSIKTFISVQIYNFKHMEIYHQLYTARHLLTLILR
jgi:hypothetical protein